MTACHVNSPRISPPSVDIFVGVLAIATWRSSDIRTLSVFAHRQEAVILLSGVYTRYGMHTDTLYVQYSTAQHNHTNLHPY